MEGAGGHYNHSSSSYHSSYPQSRQPQHLQYRTSFSKPAPYAPVDPYGQNKPAAQTSVMPKSEPATEDEEWLPDASERQQEKRSRRVKEEMDTSSGHADSHSGDSGDVKTRFPVARIKRIMQADEDVGKVAQVTPVVVSKALELFMVNLVTNAAAEAKEKSSRRVTTAHLKQAVLKDNQFDFLWDIVGKVSDTPAQGERSEDAEESKDGRKRRGGRKKRKDPDD